MLPDLFTGGGITTITEIEGRDVWRYDLDGWAEVRFTRRHAVARNHWAVAWLEDQILALSWLAMPVHDMRSL